MSIFIRALPAFAVLALAAAVPAQAQDAPNSDAALAAEMAGDNVTVGVGAAYLPDYEGSNDYRFTAAPAAIGSVKGFNFTVLGNRASIDLIPNRPGDTWDFQLGPVGVIDFNRSSLKSIDDDRVRALGKRKTSIEVGGYVGIGKTGVITSPYDKLSVSVSYRNGVSGAQRAGVIQPTVTYFTPLSRKAAVSLVASAERAERGYGAAYFDVDADESLASGLPVYRTSAGWKNVTVGLIATQALTGNLLHGFKLVGGATYKRMLNDFADSPIVSIAGSRDQWMGVLGLAYTF